MTIAAFFQIILAALKFPEEMGSFIKLLQSTPEEKRQKLLVAMRKEADSLKEGGRPTWDN